MTPGWTSLVMYVAMGVALALILWWDDRRIRARNAEYDRNLQAKIAAKHRQSPQTGGRL